MALIKITVDDHGLTGKFAAAEKLLPDHNRDGVNHISELGRDKARELAPYEVGYLFDALTYDKAHGGVYAEALIYIRGGEPPSHGKSANVYGVFQEEGYHHHGSGEYIRNPYMEPAAMYLEAGVAELTMNQAMYLALDEAGLDPSPSGLV